MHVTYLIVTFTRSVELGGDWVRVTPLGSCTRELVGCPFGAFTVQTYVVNSAARNKRFPWHRKSGNQFRPPCRFLKWVFGFVRAATSSLIREVPDVQFVTRSSLFSFLRFWKFVLLCRHVSSMCCLFRCCIGPCQCWCFLGFCCVAIWLGQIIGTVVPPSLCPPFWSCQVLDH